MSELFRVYHTGNACPFKRSVLSKIAKSETVEIIIVGGSVTYGADLRDRMKFVLILLHFSYQLNVTYVMKRKMVDKIFRYLVFWLV